MRKRKSLFKIIPILLMAGIILFVTSSAFVASADELEDKKAELSNLSEQKKESEALLEQLRAEMAQDKKDMEAINEQITAVEQVIVAYQFASDEKQKEIDRLQTEIDEKQKEIDHEYANMKKRIKFLYENVGQGYIETFLTSETFADALNKIQYLLEVANYDRKMKEKLESLQKDIKKAQEDIIIEKQEIDELKAAEEEQKAILDEMYAAKVEALNLAEGQQEDIANIIAYLDEEMTNLKQEVAKLQGGVVYNGAAFIWPLPYPYDANWITSPFGWRWGTIHAGLDIGVPIGTPIYAVADGVVVVAQGGWNGGAGLWTVICHGENQLYTEYMHQSYQCVSPGQYVTQGEVIGYTGNTGSSTGPHLHIGVIIGPWYYLQRTDPAPYLGVDEQYLIEK